MIPVLWGDGEQFYAASSTRENERKKKREREHTIISDAFDLEDKQPKFMQSFI